MNKVDVAINKNLFRLVIFLMPLFILSFLILLRWGDPHMYFFLLYEDHFLEVVTAILYAIATYFAISITINLFKMKQKWLGFFYLLISFGLFFITGEEISWGQRIFNIVSPEYFLENSTQQEINLHNLKPFQEILHRVYIVVGLVGATLWIGLYATNGIGRVFNRWIIPNWYLSLYFLPVAMFYFYYDFIRPGNDFLQLVGRDQEPNEFLLCLGFLLFVLENWLRIRQINCVPMSSILSVKLNSNYNIS